MQSKQEREKAMGGMRLVRASLVGLGMTLLLGAGSAYALQPVNPVDGCGQTLPKLGDDGTKEYVLTGDLACSGAVNGVNITASGVTFHLAGHTISNPTACVALENMESVGIFAHGGILKVYIDGGTVSGFNDGIVLSSSKSRVRGMTVTEACVFGILVGGVKNRVYTNVVTANKNDGIALDSAHNALIASNDTSGNTRGGIMLSDFSDNNTITNNVSNNNGGGGEGHGIVIYNGANNLIRNNVTNGNDFAGIRITSEANTAKGNMVSGNADVGIWIVAGGTMSNVHNNTVLGSGNTDMQDDNANCDANMWKNNTFQTDVVAAGVPDGGPGVGCIQ